MRFAMMLACLLACDARYVAAQVVNPATQEQEKKEKTEKTEKKDDQKPVNQGHTWELEPVTVYGKAPKVEEDRIGEYAQPRWTTHRRFSETRVYVIPKGMVDFEYLADSGNAEGRLDGFQEPVRDRVRPAAANPARSLRRRAQDRAPGRPVRD